MIGLGWLGWLAGWLAGWLVALFSSSIVFSIFRKRTIFFEKNREFEKTKQIYPDRVLTRRRVASAGTARDGAKGGASNTPASLATANNKGIDLESSTRRSPASSLAGRASSLPATAASPAGHEGVSRDRPRASGCVAKVE